jgi:hypothetical protein
MNEPNYKVRVNWKTLNGTEHTGIIEEICWVDCLIREDDNSLQQVNLDNLIVTSGGSLGIRIDDVTTFLITEEGVAK